MKKNQFALIFLTIITMLAVWYIKTPIQASGPADGDGDQTTVSSGRLAELLAMREAVRGERSILTAGFDAILADEAATLASKENALQEKKQLSALTEKEVLMEIQVIQLGYRDAFVHSTATGVEVIVISETNSGASAVEIINTVLKSFDTTENVIVNFMTSDEIKKA